MSYLFKATLVAFDQNAREFYDSGHEVVINMNFVVSFTSANLGSTKKREGLGQVFWVNTTIDHSGHAIRVTSKYLESLMEHAE